MPVSYSITKFLNIPHRLSTLSNNSSSSCCCYFDVRLQLHLFLRAKEVLLLQLAVYSSLSLKNNRQMLYVLING